MIAKIVAGASQLCLLGSAVASWKYPLLVKLFGVFATLDVVCHTTLRLPAERHEDQYRFLVMLTLQCLFQFGIKSGFAVIFLANIGFATVEGVLDAASLYESGRLFHLVVWTCVQTLSAFTVQVLINAIGSQHTDVQVLGQERSRSTRLKAKNVLVLNKVNYEVL